MTAIQTALHALKRRPTEAAVMGLMWLSAGFAVLITAAIVFSVLREGTCFTVYWPMWEG